MKNELWKICKKYTNNVGIDVRKDLNYYEIKLGKEGMKYAKQIANDINSSLDSQVKKIRIDYNGLNDIACWIDVYPEGKVMDSKMKDESYNKIKNKVVVTKEIPCAGGYDDKFYEEEYGIKLLKERQSGHNAMVILKGTVEALVDLFLDEGSGYKWSDIFKEPKPKDFYDFYGDSVKAKDNKIKDSLYKYLADPDTEKELIENAKKARCKLEKIGGLIAITSDSKTFSRLFDIPEEELINAAKRPMSALKKISDSEIKDYKPELLAELKKIAMEGEKIKPQIKTALKLYYEVGNYYSWQKLKEENPRKAEMISKGKELAEKKTLALAQKWDRIIEEMNRGQTSWRANFDKLARGDGFDAILPTMGEYREVEERIKGLEMSKGENPYAARVKRLSKNDSLKSYMFTSKDSGRRFVVKAKNTQDAITKFYNAAKVKDETFEFTVHYKNGKVMKEKAEGKSYHEALKKILLRNDVDSVDDIKDSKKSPRQLGDMPYNGRPLVKESKAKYVLVEQKLWNKYGINSMVSSERNDLNDALRTKQSLQEQDKINYIIYDTKNKKVI